MTFRWYSRQILPDRIIVAVAALACLGYITSAAAQPSLQAQSEIAGRQLIVLFDPTDSLSPKATDIVDAVAGSKPSALLLSQLGYPNAAHRVLEGISSAEVLAESVRSPRARRSLLEGYVVLTYLTPEAANAAAAILDKDPRVLSVESNFAFSLTAGATPTDKYFSQDPLHPDAANYQWGMQLLNMPTAWARERGTAYVAATDAGIDCGGNNPCTQSSLHPDLKQNTRLHFSKNFYLSGSTVLTNDDISNCSGNPCSAVHGTHVAGVIAATPNFGSYSNGDNNSGVAGACWTCSLSMIRLTDLYNATTGAAITYAADHGAQVINMSWGDQYAGTRYGTCSTTDYSLVCQALGHAADLDIVSVAASGNGYENRINFPARVSTVIAVGGLESGGGFFRNGYGNGNTCIPGTAGDECGSNYGTQDDGSPQVVAPARDVVSSVYRSHDHNAYVHCGDSYGPDGGAQDGYGDCTGTSMASPHVAGVVALIRSANPLLSYSTVKSTVLNNTIACAGLDATKCGSGYPDADKLVLAALGGTAVKNRLTPLFSFYSASANDHFYTVTPQMANAALYSGRLLPQPPGASVSYVPIGPATPGYNNFPIPPDCFGPCPSAQTPRAMVSVFTSHVDPTNASAELVPLYRMSWKCASSCSHVSHIYVTTSSDISAAQSVGYTIDGIEGYVYPTTRARPSGTVKLCRKYASTRDDYMLFAGTGADGGTCGTNDGYTKDVSGNLLNDYTGSFSLDWVGWVHQVTAPKPVYSTGYLAALNLLFD